MKNAAQNYQVFWYEELDSTNAELLRRISELDNLSVAAALTQTQGRGQKGNKWLSAPGENLTFSVLLRPAALPLSEFMSISLLSTLVISDFLALEGIDCKVKWPNDIYVGKKKICGILIESVVKNGKVDSAVIGIGLNLNQTEFPGELPNPTSATLLTGRAYGLKETLTSIMDIFESSAPLLDTHQGRASLRARYEDRLFQKGELCRYRDLRTGELIEGTILGIADDGRLNLDGRLYDFKEIGYIL